MDYAVISIMCIALVILELDEHVGLLCAYQVTAHFRLEMFLAGCLGNRLLMARSGSLLRLVLGGGVG